MMMDQLRTATRTNHQRTEAALNLQAACASLTAYTDLLCSFMSLYRPLESYLSLHRWTEFGINWAERRKTPLLEHDLTILGRDPEKVNDFDIRRVHRDGIAAAFGVLYVLEGSTLGGQYIRKHVASSLGLDANSGCRFFEGYGASTAAMWKQFGDALNHAALAIPDFQADCCHAAIQTFDLFEAVFSRHNGNRVEYGVAAHS